MRTRDVTIPLALWICAAICAHFFFGTGGLVVAQVHDDRSELLRLSHAASSLANRGEQTFEGEVTGVINAGVFVAFGDGFEGMVPVRAPLLRLSLTSCHLMSRSGSTATFTGATDGWSRSTVRFSPPISSSS